MRLDPLVSRALSLFLLEGGVACEPAPLNDDVRYEAPVPLPVCRGNNDGVIEASELPMVPGVLARYRVREGPLDVDVAGRKEGGVRIWDLTLPDPRGEPLVELSAEHIDGHWFADSFPEATLAGPLEASGELLGALGTGDDAIVLFGVASREPEPEEGKTLLVYDTPVTLYAFPLAEGDRFTTTARARDARLYGLPTALDDRYEVEVTGRGTLRLPDLILENTLRVTVRLERTLVVGDARQTSHIFVHECLGEVARIVSETKPLAEEILDDFDKAQEVWRLSL